MPSDLLEKYEPIIGLEIHIALKTKSKMFCSCDNTGEDKPVNTTICPVCTGQPGVLPVPNAQAIEWAVMAASALHCKIPERSKFDRKHYFYPDLPKGYQISQYDEPIGTEGRLDLHTDGTTHRIGITRLHLEEDAAKLIHPTGKKHSIVDFNRAGTPLVEIVTEPDIRSPEHARAFLQELQLVARYLRISDADMEKGQMRCDANVSVRPRGTVQLSPKTELKNLNSTRSVERALAFELERQMELWEQGSPDESQSTRSWNETKGETVVQRTKEEAADYRYFPEPDIPPLEFTNSVLKSIQASIPELPEQRRTRFMQSYGLPAEDIEVLVTNSKLGEFAEDAISDLKEWASSAQQDWETVGPKLTKTLANWLINRLTKILADAGQTLATSKVTRENFAEFSKIVAEGKVNSQAAQTVLEEMVKTGGDPSHIIEEHGLAQIEDEELLNQLVLKVIETNAKVVQDYKNGKKVALKFLIGHVMKETKGKANPQAIEKLLKEKLA